MVTMLARGLARRGHQVTVCTTDVCDASARLQRPAAHGRFQPWTSGGESGNVATRVFPNVSNRAAYHGQCFLPCGLGAYLRQHAAEFDVGHLHACRNVPGVLAARHLRRVGVPYVLAPNGTAPRIERRQLAKQIFDFLAGRRVMIGAARLIAVSDAERRDLERVAGDPEAIRIVPNSIDVDEFDPPVERGEFRRRAGLGEAPVVLFLGKITPRKRLDVVVKAFAQLTHRNARLVIAGNDMGSVGSARSLVRRLGLSSRTLFTGLLAGRERLEALADADVLVYPSEREVFGLVPLESLLCGTPVVVGDDSGCGEVVRSTGGGLLVPIGDPAALAIAIDDVLAHGSSWRAAAAAAAHVARATYNSDIVCAQLERVYEEMTA